MSSVERFKRELGGNGSGSGIRLFIYNIYS